MSANLLKIISFLYRPLTNKIITVRNRTDIESVIMPNEKTDARGICTFPVTCKGDGFIHATHTTPFPDTAETDWENCWAFYNFEIEQVVA